MATKHARALLAVLVMLTASAAAQPTSGAAGAFAVAYVETRTDAAAAGRAALERYRDGVVGQAGCVAVELFEQAGRPGRFAVVESWRDQAAFEARDTGAKRALLEALSAIRISDYDERPYKALTVGSGGIGAERSNRFVITHVDVAPNTQAPQLLTRLAERSRATGAAKRRSTSTSRRPTRASTATRCSR